MKPFKPAVYFAWLVLFPNLLFSQVFTNKETGKDQEVKKEQFAEEEYPYSLPILGKKAAAAGYSLPYSAGVGTNFLWQKSDLIIDNLQIGFNGGEMISLDDVITFNNSVSESYSINVRPDIWLFPFLNVYGILASTWATTTVDFSVYAPGGETSEEILQMETAAEFHGTTFGVGMTPTIGVANGWMALDMNFTWTDLPELSKPAFAFIFGPRFGKTFKFKKPERNIALWAGAFRVSLNTGTTGSLPLDGLVPEDIYDRIENGYARLDDAQMNLDSWYNNLSPLEQDRFRHIYDRGNEIISNTNNLLSDLEYKLNDDVSSSVQYSLDKKQSGLWNFLIGTQYQHNKHWMVRAEMGFLGTRTQFIGGLQYRFGL